jgi:integrase
MRVPSYRKHSSGQARVTINGKDHLLGKYGSQQSKELYGRLIAQFAASGHLDSFGITRTILIQDFALAYLRHSKVYYAGSPEHANMKPVIARLVELYGSAEANSFGAAEFKVVRQAWIDAGRNARQSINRQMARLLRAVKWGVSENLLPATNYQAMRCVEPLKRGRCAAKESTGIAPVEQQLVDQTLKHVTHVVADMIRLQILTGCRPGEVVKIKPEMVDRSDDVWLIRLQDHKTAHRGRERTIYCGPKAQAVLAPYLLRGPDKFCFSPIESEKQRRQAIHDARLTAKNQGNRPGYSKRFRLCRKPRKEPGISWTAGTFARAIRNACEREGLKTWSPNQLRHSAATAIRKQFGLEAAQVILGHSELGVTQIYAEADKQKAIDVARRIG